jgi:hypothetical protein
VKNSGPTRGGDDFGKACKIAHVHTTFPKCHTPNTLSTVSLISFLSSHQSSYVSKEGKRVSSKTFGADSLSVRFLVRKDFRRCTQSRLMECRVNSLKRVSGDESVGRCEDHNRIKGKGGDQFQSLEIKRRSAES